MYEHEMKMKAAQSSGLIGGAQHDAAGAIPQRDRPPVEVSAQRLFERLGYLQSEADLLTDRLAMVMRPELKGTGENSVRAPSECGLVDLLEQAADRVEQVISRLASARSRLCV